MTKRFLHLPSIPLSLSLSPSIFLYLLPPLLLLLHLPGSVRGDCWLIEGDKGYVWLAICSQNQPPYETIPQHINNTVHDLRLNENKLKAVLFHSMYRFTNLTDLNLTKNDISYIEDGAFTHQANLQVLQLGYNKLTNLTEGMMRGLGRLQCLFLQHNLIEVIDNKAFEESSSSLSSIDLSSNKLARIDPSTFTVLNRLMVCELAGNPFHCGCDLYSFLTWLEAFNNVTHTYDRLQCETPGELFLYPLLSPVAGHGRSARTMLSTICRDGMIIPGITSQPGTDWEGSGMGPEMDGRAGPYHQPTASSTADPNFNPSIKLQWVTLSAAKLLVQIPKPYSKMYVLVQYNQSFVSDIQNLKEKKEKVTLVDLKPHTNYTYCVVSISKNQRNNHTCIFFATREAGPDDHHANPSTMTHYIMTILGCLLGMVIVLGLVYYCLRKRRMQEEKEKAISVKKTILEMRYGPEAAAQAANDPAAMQHLQEQAQNQGHPGGHLHGGGGGGNKLPPSASSSSGMLHGSANTTSSRLSTLPQVEKMATAFGEAMATNKGNYMDVRSGAGLSGDGGGLLLAGGGGGGGEAILVAMRGINGCSEDGMDVGNDSDDDGHGSASEISTIAMEVDKVNQIINNCIDALKLDSLVATTTSGDNPTSPPPACITSLARNLIPLSQGLADTCQMLASSPKIHAPPAMTPVPLVMPLSERPGISGGGFLSPPYRDPPPANAVRPLQRQLSDTGVVVMGAGKNRCSVSSAGGSMKSTRVFSLDVPEPRSPGPNSCPAYPEKGSPVRCGETMERLPLVGGNGSGCGSGGDGNGMGCGGGNGMGGGVNEGGVNVNGGGVGCGGGGRGGGGPGKQQQHHHLEVHPDYHCSEHRHSFPALYYEGANDSPSPSPSQKASFLKPLGRTKRDPAAYSQLSPSRHHNYSGYSSSPEYSSENTLRIWERFRPHKKGPRDPREEATYIAAGHALRKKVQFAKDEDLHDILDYWKGVSAQQKL
ncbi:protein phosphatase 1 regulatory subunit 29 [Salmo salar]|uniref:Protein phosphatase 1 regulatory subunit 29 n=1 Tax=Salmo salar TaxID=8030 RepID=A0A1S3L503_SALSA|nr:protein phosphatase 1 regulatory subunit 29-like [Salmo salar]|eukprot:XP_013986018.1 PREDICTED: protein phosphatase 1 regulatory subunit 29-like [Salmo salar]